MVNPALPFFWSGSQKRVTEIKDSHGIQSEVGQSWALREKYVKCRKRGLQRLSKKSLLRRSSRGRGGKPGGILGRMEKNF